MRGADPEIHAAGKLKQECTLLIVSHDLRELTPLVSPCSGLACSWLPRLSMYGLRMWPSMCFLQSRRCALYVQVDYAWEMQPGGKLLPVTWPPPKMAFN